MKPFKTEAIVLSRLNFGERDRILSVLTPDHGKIRLIARGVRSLKSKLAGGIELFSVNELNLIKGRGELMTLVSSRLETNFPDILNDIERVQLGYEILKLIDRTTEDAAGPEFFELLMKALAGLNQKLVSLTTIKLWFYLNLLAVSGFSPNLYTSSNGTNLVLSEHYNFDDESMVFSASDNGRFNTDNIKYLRVALAAGSPAKLNQVVGSSKQSKELLPLVIQIHRRHLL